MTWSRFDDAASTHPKARLAGNEAWALWVGAVMYCNRYLTDGFVPWAALATECLPEPITPAKAKRLAQRAADAKIRQGGPGLFVLVEGGAMVHDFLGWNPCKADVEAKRKADRDRKRGPKNSAPESGDSPPRIPNGNQSGARTDSVAHTIPAQPAQPKKEDPPTPLPPVTPKRPDPLADSLTGNGPASRADVQELHADWRESFGRTGAKLRVGWGSDDAKILADCIDAHGLADCKLVAKHAPNDGMVSGRVDEHKQTHESIKYIFGTEETFSRILRDAKKAERKSGLSAIEKIEAAGELR